MIKVKLFLSGAKKSPKLWSLLNKYMIKTALVVIFLMMIVLAVTGIESPMMQGILESTKGKILIFGGVVAFALVYNVQKIGSLMQDKPELIEARLLEPKEYRKRVMEFVKNIMSAVGEDSANQQSKDAMLTFVKLSFKSALVYGAFYCMVGWSFIRLTEFHLLINILFIGFLFYSWLRNISMKSFEGIFEEYGLKK